MMARGRYKYKFALTAEEREELESTVKRGRSAAYRIRHAQILLKTDSAGPDLPDAAVAEFLSCSKDTVYQVRRRFVEEGLESALNRKKRETPPTPRVLDGAKEARLIALACSEPPEGRAAWTLQLLSDKMVELRIVERISPSTVERALKKTRSGRICANVTSSRRNTRRNS